VRTQPARQHPAFNGWTVFLVLIAFYTVLTRFWALGTRQLHVDEGVHFLQAFSFYKYLFHRPFPQGLYRYDPFFHGPLFYYFMLPVYGLLGPTRFAVRFPAAFFGTLSVFTPLLFRHDIKRTSAGLAIAILATSATFTWTARLGRMDYMFHFFCVLTVFFLFRFLRARLALDGFLAAISYALMFSSKEESFVFTAELGMFLFLYMVKRILDTDGFLLELRGFIKTRGPILMGMVGVFVIVYTLLYSTFLANPHGFIDGFLTALSHWRGQHQRGPFDNDFLYHFRLLYLREPVFLIVLISCGTLVSWRRKWLFPYWLLFGGLTAYMMSSQDAYLTLPKYFNRFHLVYAEDMLGAAIVVMAGGYLFLSGLGRNNNSRREPLVFQFFYFWATFNFLFYGFVREKLPWLFLHVEVRLRRKPVERFAVGLLGASLLLFSLRMNYRQNWAGPQKGHFVFGDSQGLLPQDVDKLLSDVKDYARASGKGRRLQIDVMDRNGYMGWLMQAYFMMRFDSVEWNGRGRDADVIIATPELMLQAAEMLPGSKANDYKIVAWRGIDFRSLGWKELLSFYRFPESFSNGSSGSMGVEVFFR